MPKNTALAAIERNKEAIAKLGDTIFYYGELGMQEFKTNTLLAETLEKMGYTLSKEISGIPTALLATYGSGKPVIAIHFEIDALPRGSQRPMSVTHDPLVEGAPGHAEGHNANAAVGVGAAFALKEAIDKYNLPGTIKVFTAPAEEQGIPRPFFVRDGYFDDVDASFHVHIRSNLSVNYGLRQYALISVEFTFKGKTAHAALYPWLGNSAVDAVKLMDLGWDVLREHLEPTQRSHSVITDGGAQPNIVPDTATIWYFLRESNGEKAQVLLDKLRKVAAGAALMTGTKYEENILAAMWPNRDNRTIAEIVQSNIEIVGMPEWTEEEQNFAKKLQQSMGKPTIGLVTEITPLKEVITQPGSNDAGDISWLVPQVRLNFPSNIPGAEFHHWSAGVAPATSIAHKGEVAGAKVLAGSIIDLLTHPELVEKAKATLKEEIGDVVYKSLLPPDSKPPIHLNKEIMDKYRPLLEKFYLNDPIEFK
ncbi:MAG: amidohydrolase [bacterium]